MPDPAESPEPRTSPIAFTNVRLFDGKSKALRTGLQVVVEGRTIKTVEPSNVGVPSNVESIDGGGLTLIPGLIDAHWHALLTRPSIAVALTADWNYVHTLAVAEARATLMRGVTTVRDLGGPAFGLKRAIDEGVAPGPRIYPSGAFISQTSGHGDFRYLHEVPRAPGDPLSYTERLGFAALADGPDAVRMRAREQLMKGATQLKYMAGGGISSPYDPIDVTQGTVAEMRAAVEAAENWGTYVAVHAYTPRAVRFAIEAGVKCIEHGHLVDDETAKLMGDAGVWWSLQPFLNDRDMPAMPDPVIRAKLVQMLEGTDAAYELAKKYRIKTAWGTDILFDAKLAKRQGAMLAKLARWYAPADILKMATADNGELLATSGPRNPYPGKLGVIEEGAMADLILVDGDPLQNLDLISDPDENFVVIMKDGRIYKDSRSRRHDGTWHSS
ncbi:MAG TPA: amidohydrolase family protein [Candidatus Tumulicola sp.]|jgi:imidazolonepropionase-like amidohydrolase